MTETAPERLEAIRAALAELVAEHGAELLSNPARMSNLIKDLLPDDQQLARILVIAAEQDVASKLREHVSQGMDAATATRLVATTFAASTMFAQQACLWVVGELAVAMGLASGENTAPASSEPDPVPVQANAAAHPAGPPRPSSRRGLYLASGTTAVVIAVIAAVILGIKIGSAPTTSRPPAGHSPLSSRSPAIAHAPAQGSFVIGRHFFDDGSLALTLTRIKLHGNLMTVYVSYRSSTGRPEILSCLGDDDPSASSITLADGSVIPSAATYCSDHPGHTFTLNGSATHASYAVFHITAGFPEPFKFSWPADNNTGTVSNIKL
jgi:hypothetical protein